MPDIEGIKKQLEKRVKPSPKTPYNPVTWTLVFSDAGWAILDIGSGLGVWYLTTYWYYGLIVFLSGIVPLIMWQIMKVQAYATQEQKEYADSGEKLAIGSVIGTAVFIAIIRFVVDGVYVEAALAAALVGVLARHSYLARKYYFADEEIVRRQNAAQMRAAAKQSVVEYEITREVLDAESEAVKARKEVEKAYSPELVSKVLGEDDPNR